jgi:sugar phosphate isomerase/epimerase
MKISFSTLGCPAWDLDTICRRGHEYGFDGIDFRGYLETLDVTRLTEFTTHIERTHRALGDAGLEVSGISSSIHLCIPEQLADNLAEARRTIALAQGLQTSNVRVFGGGDLLKHNRSQLVQFAKESMEAILSLDGAVNLRWLFETHDIWIQSSDCRLILDQIPHPAFGVLWDIGNTPLSGAESPEETVSTLGGRIGYLHIKDAVYDPNHPQALPDGRRYVTPGAGEIPLEKAIRVLAGSGYDGWMQYEFEKRWHPDLEEPETALPAFADWARGVISRL